MQGVLEIRRRIRSVREIHHITRAMKMVAATKIKYARERVEASRPFARKINEVLLDIYHLAGRVSGAGKLHPLMETRPPRKVALIVITSDRGLAGAYNSNILRYTMAHIRNRADHPEFGIIAVGRKGRDYFRRLNRQLLGEFIDAPEMASFARAREIAAHVIPMFLRKEIDEVDIIYSRFYSAHKQRPRLFRLLPIVPVEPAELQPLRAAWVFEPSPQDILEHLIPRYIEAEIYRSLLEAAAGEQGARMTSMGAATDNAEKILKELTLQYNHSRQSLITRELTELMGGVEAQR
ncbi:MAG TPA: ATP synthase F1 subunit gamma [Firmicutes bacterium]|jgi:F-type H+-transporting ATPase subunit gamma|nr:ATP synthase F1 subunit gamma [Bacillota bacterium]